MKTIYECDLWGQIHKDHSQEYEQGVQVTNKQLLPHRFSKPCSVSCH